ncbi:hypothetical protein F908_03042 [Acinetobacter sp. NIPH 284]|nr:hypothetical protein F908_03042 [Acinetobacter sp. NIPH 284]
MRIIHLARQGGENKNDELSPFFDQQVQQVFYNIQQALASIQATLSDIAMLRVLIVDHDTQKHQLVIKTIVDLRKTYEFPVCTLIPVTGLALPEMQIEIEATAYTALEPEKRILCQRPKI